MAPLDFDSLSPPDRLNLELAARRTRLALYRTRMGADRTLMAMTRTSLSLLAFGFTAFQFFDNLGASVGLIPRSVASGRLVGLGLVVVGSLFQALGVLKHTTFIAELRREQDELAFHLAETRPRVGHLTELLIAAAVLVMGAAATLLLALQGAR